MRVSPVTAAPGTRTLAIDIGDTGIKALVLGPDGSALTERVRVDTPRPATPGAVLRVLWPLIEPLGDFDRVSVGFPGVVVDGVPGVTILTAWMDYASPEQLMGKPLDARSDVYSLGVVAYELVTGRRPFADANGPAGLITKQIKERPVSPSERGAPAAADAVILRCLEKAPGDRFPDRAAFREALALAAEIAP